MDFMEAVKAMKEGKKVKRSWMRGYIVSDENRGLDFPDGYYGLRPSDFEANDWEIVDEDEDWNLAEKFFEMGTNFYPDISKMEFKDVVYLDDVKKLKTKLHEDFTVNFAKANTLQELYDMDEESINKRFGDI